jgi:palmitoyl-protein thioesterase
MRFSIYTSYILIAFLVLNYSTCAYPVAIFHGIGDVCLLDPGMWKIESFFSKNLGGVHVKCIETAGGPLDWVTSFKSQAEKACKKINEDKDFEGDFSVVGLSQGSLLARYVIETCEMKGRVKRYVSVGGPQMGVASFPQCESGMVCNIVNKVVDTAVYFSMVQHIIGPAGYFKDVSHYKNYLTYSSFLPDLNNERQDKNDSYKERFSNLEKIVLIKFSEDSMIIPKETAWFQFYDESHKLLPLEESEFYKNDFIGVKKLNEEKKIQFVEIEGQHLEFDEDDILTYMIPALQ